VPTSLGQGPVPPAATDTKSNEPATSRDADTLLVLTDDAGEAVLFWAIGNQSHLMMAAKPDGPCADLVRQIAGRLPPFDGMSCPDILLDLEQRNWRAGRFEVTDDWVSRLGSCLDEWGTDLVRI